MRINTDISSLVEANALQKTESTMAQSMQRLSSDLRINSALDDAAGLAISSKMTSQVRGLNQAVRNANDAILMIQGAEGATQAVTDMLQLMRELAVQAVSDSNADSYRAARGSHAVGRGHWVPPPVSLN